MDASAGGILLTVALTALIIAAGLSLIFGDSTASRAARLANFTRRQGVTVTGRERPDGHEGVGAEPTLAPPGVVRQPVAGVKVRSVPSAPGRRAQIDRTRSDHHLRRLVPDRSWRSGAAGSAPAGARAAAGLASRRVRDFVPAPSGVGSPSPSP